MLEQQRPDEKTEHTAQSQAKRIRVHRVQMAAQHDGLGEKVSRHFGYFQAQQILDLRQRNQHGNAIGESHNDADRHITHQRSELEQPQQKQQHPGASGGNQQIGDAVALNNAVNDHDESAGWPANLHR